MREIKITEKEAGLDILKFASRILNDAPRSLIYKFIRNKNIELNGRKCSGQDILRSGDTVSFFLSDETYDKFHTLDASPEDVSPAALETSRIIYEDDDFIFYDKPAGLRVQSDSSGKQSLNDMLISYVGTTEAFKPSICNRLDTNTSGIVLCGKSYEGLETLNRAIRERRIRKYYRGIAAGFIKGDKHLVSFLDDSDKDNIVAVSDTPKHGFKEVITDVRVIAKGRLATYAEFELITGRKHQIRAQLAHMGHPLVGDMKYGEKKPGLGFAKRQMLHAYRVELPSDILFGMTVFAPIPSDMEECMEKTGIRV